MKKNPNNDKERKNEKRKNKEREDNREDKKKSDEKRNDGIMDVEKVEREIKGSKNSENFRKNLREELIKSTKQAISESATPDQLIIQASTSLDQLEHALHTLTKKAREWYGLINPELERAVQDQDSFLKRADTDRIGEMGAHLKRAELDALRGFLNALRTLAAEKEALRTHLERMMNEHYPNVALLATPRIGAQLLVHAGSISRLASVPSSTIQLYGAETALFRHLKDKRRHRSPKYGLIFNHILIQNVALKLRGKAARALADKLSICAKLDRFKGELRAPEYKKSLEKKFGVEEW